MTENNEDGVWYEDEPYTEIGEELNRVLGELTPQEMAEELLRFVSKQDPEVIKIMHGRWNYEVIYFMLEQAAEQGAPYSQATFFAFEKLREHAMDTMSEYYPEEDGSMPRFE